MTSQRSTAFGRLLLCGAIAASVLAGVRVAAAQTSRAEIEQAVRDYLASNPDEVRRLLQDLLAKNPDLLRNALLDMVKRRPAAAETGDNAAVIRANADLLLHSNRHVTLGNRQGDVTLVEFFDYNCGFCRRALDDMLALTKTDANLRIVLKELPVLGPDSLDAARVGVAVRMQDGGGEKYLAFHQALLRERGRIDRARAVAAAAEAGLDAARLQADLASDDIAATLAENARLARALGISGTPSYVVGDTVKIGAVGLAALTELVHATRNAKALR